MIAFAHIHKTGGTTLKYILRRSFGARHCDARIYPRPVKSKGVNRKRVLSAKDLRLTNWAYPNLKSVAGHMVTSYSDIHTLPGVKLYTFLRNPVERTISRYKEVVHFNDSPAPILDWLQKDENRNGQTKKIAGCENGQLAIEILKERIGFVGIMEKFDKSLILLKEWINDDRFDPRYEIKNTAKTDLPAFDEVVLEAIREANAEDLKVYEFVCSEIWSEQVKSYPGNLKADTEKLTKENLTFKDFKSKKGKLTRGIYWLILPLISIGKVFSE